METRIALTLVLFCVGKHGRRNPTYFDQSGWYWYYVSEKWLLRPPHRVSDCRIATINFGCCSCGHFFALQHIARQLRPAQNIDIYDGVNFATVLVKSDPIVPNKLPRSHGVCL